MKKKMGRHLVNDRKRLINRKDGKWGENCPYKVLKLCIINSVNKYTLNLHKPDPALGNDQSAALTERTV